MKMGREECRRAWSGCTLSRVCAALCLRPGCRCPSPTEGAVAGSKVSQLRCCKCHVCDSDWDTQSAERQGSLRIGRYLSVPPPAQQRAMRDPCVQPVLLEESKVRPDHMQLRLGALLVGHDAVEEADIIVAEQVVLPRRRVN